MICKIYSSAKLDLFWKTTVLLCVHFYSFDLKIIVSRFEDPHSGFWLSCRSKVFKVILILRFWSFEACHCFCSSTAYVVKHFTSVNYSCSFKGFLKILHSACEHARNTNSKYFCCSCKQGVLTEGEAQYSWPPCTN